MYVCMYVCIYVCMYVCVYVCMYVYDTYMYIWGYMYLLRLAVTFLTHAQHVITHVHRMQPMYLL
jgi:hypothetical protein